MRDQADQLRKLVRETVSEHPALEPGVPLVVVSGGKSGLGVSTIAIQLARELARLGKRTVLADANLQQPDMTRRLAGQPDRCVAEILSGDRSAVEVLRPLGESIQLLPGRWSSDTPPQIDREAVKRFLTGIRSLGAHAEVIILDAGHGMSPWVQQLWRAAHQVLLVTNLDADAMKQTYTAVKLAPWGDVDSKVRLVMNQAEASSLVRQAGERFAATCRRFLGVNICEPAAVVTCASSSDLLADRSSATNANTPYNQSICLLAAEVLSSCLVLSNYRKQHHASSAKKVLKFPNKAQTASQV